MKVCFATLEGISPYSQSRAHEEPKLDRETSDAYEKRTWASKAHIEDGKVYIPPMSFKLGLDRAAKMLSLQIPGKGKKTYTAFFESGVLCTERVFIGDASMMKCERVHANADGKRGSGTRVWRLFPRYDNWTATVRFDVLANEITTEVFEQHIVQAGAFVGIGRFRPEKGGYFGRYKVNRLDWQ